MDKFLRSFITIEKSLQITTLVGLMLLLGYLGFVNIRSERTPSAQVSSSATLHSCLLHGFSHSVIPALRSESAT